MNSKHIGLIAEAKVIARLIELGISVLKPLGDNDPFDIVTYENGKFLRGQIKMGKKNKTGSSFKFNSRKFNPFKKTCSFYNGQIDVFYTYERDSGNVYKVPLSELSNNQYSVVLRLKKSKNNQSKKTKWADDYKI